MDTQQCLKQDNWMVAISNVFRTNHIAIITVDIFIIKALHLTYFQYCGHSRAIYRAIIYSGHC